MTPGNGNSTIWRWVLSVALGVIGTLVLAFAMNVTKEINELREAITVERLRSLEVDSESKRDRTDLLRRIERIEAFHERFNDDRERR